MTFKADRMSRVPEALMLGIAVAIALAIAFLSQKSSAAEKIAEDQRQLSQEIASLNADLVATLGNAQTAQRGFLLTGNDLYLQPYNQAVTAIPRLLNRLRMIAALRPNISAELRRVDPLVTAQLATLKTTIDLRRARRLPEALEIVDTDRDHAYMDQIRAVCARIGEIAQRRQAMFEDEAAASARTLRLVSTGGGILLAGFLVFATITIFRGMDRREELARRALAGEKLLATTLAGIADGVIATDEQARITFINPVAQKLTGWSEAQAAGVLIDDVFVIVNEATRLKVENPIDKALAQGVVVGLANHTNLISRSGNDIPIDDSAAPLRDENGKVIGAVIVFRDISERRRAENQLRAANAELQQFVDAAAHDLRAPLNSVSTLAELLAARFSAGLGPEGLRIIGHIGDGLGRMRRLLEDLLEFARASHFDERSARPLPLESALQSAIQNLDAAIAESRAQITCEPLPLVAMHETHAVQLFQNILGNAIKYRGAETPRIHVRAELTDSGWLISIADNGIGIDPQYMETIFKPFRRLHADRVYPGSGIGLTTCRKIVTGYGGSIWAESEPRKGSVFRFTLPAAAAASAIRRASA